MGPLVPDIIGNELNLIVALFIGVAFGFILEQAGFSTSKKLVGLFYGYDFTVLRVFFTGGVTAMVGVIALTHFGLLDIDLVYINPTFLWSAIVGGLIMGLGFVIGGYCPGTSVCAMAIGKIDAMYFVGGSFLGVFAFAEAYPFLEGLYKDAAWGNVRLFETLNISQGLFSFALIFAAIFAFWAVSYIETRVNKTKIPKAAKLKNYLSFSVIGILIGILTIFMPDKKESMIAQVNDAAFVNNYNIKPMDSEELAFRLMDEDLNLQIFDMRNSKSFNLQSLPQSRNINIKNLFDKDSYKLLSIKNKRNVFVAEDEFTAKQAAVLAQELGYQNVRYLKGGLKEFSNNYLSNFAIASVDGAKPSDRDRFRAEASIALPELIKKAKSKNIEAGAKKSKRVLGGC